MCCLFGFMDPGNSLSHREKQRLLTALAIASEDRGTDATGIAYVHRSTIQIRKKPLPARRMKLQIPGDVTTVMGHTRMTTQGSEKRNYNNHPFSGYVTAGQFALAHNGVLYNDKSLQRSECISPNKIETDSYIAVQLLEQSKALKFSTLQQMAEKVEGSFVFTVLEDTGRVWFVKGSNPLCLYFDKLTGLYVYASTMDILRKALACTALRWKRFQSIVSMEGDILCIHPDGTLEQGEFQPKIGILPYVNPWARYDPYNSKTYLAELRDIAPSFGLESKDVDTLYLEGFSPEEIEEWFYAQP